MLRFALTISCLLCLAGCKTSGELRRIPAGEVGPANSTDATLVTDATAYLRERLNAGDCYRIYSEASEQFRGRISGDDWGRACRELRADLGSWDSSVTRSTGISQGLAFVDGTAAFSGVPGRFVITWEIENKTARLVALSLESGGRGLIIPETSTLPKFMDPPLPINPIATPPGGLIPTKS